MYPANSFFYPQDPESQRRQALAKVYGFLLTLAEEKKNAEKLQETVIATESNPEPLQENIPPAV